MFVNENTSDRLVLRYWPVVEMLVAASAGALFFWTLAYPDSESSVPRFLSLVSLAALALFFGLFAGTATCVFDRRAGRVTLTTKSLIAQESTEVALADIIGTKVEETIDSDGNTTRPVLVLANTIIPMRTNSISGTASARTVVMVEAWLARTQAPIA
jgi:hypothetical protein